jgi:hypothetical protein
MSSSEQQNTHLREHPGAIGQGGGAFDARGKAAENVYFRAQEAEQLAEIKKNLGQQNQTYQPTDAGNK